MNTKLKIIGLHCGNCANKIDERLQKEARFQKSTLVFSSSVMYITTENPLTQEDMDYINKLVDEIEPGTKVVSFDEGQHKHNEEEGCGCGHDHHHHEKENFFKKHKNLTEIILSFLLIVVSLFVKNQNIAMAVTVVALLISGHGIFKKGITGIFKKRIDENLLMTIACLGALLINETVEAGAIIILFRIGHMLEEIAVNKTRRDIGAISEIIPQFGNLVVGNETQKISANQIKIGDILLVKPSEKIPVDGVITEGNSSVDFSSLTGESVPVNKHQGDEILSGGINLLSPIYIKAEKSFDNSTASKIVELVELSASKKSKTQNFITKFAKIYTPIILVLAILVAVVPPMLGWSTYGESIEKALIFIVSACPCALVVATPLGFFAGVGAISRKGVLIKGSKYIEVLANANKFVFDKTGTITSGKLKVQKIVNVSENDENYILEVVASVSRFSSHPISQSVVNSFKGEFRNDITDIAEVPGYGLKAILDGKEVLVGSKKMMTINSVLVDKNINSNIFLAVEGELKGYIEISDSIRESAKAGIEQLQNHNIEVTILTGDNKVKALEVAEQCNVSNIFYELLPEDKVNKLEELKNNKGKVVFVGDGINDAPVLVASDMGISMGLGTDIAIESSDGVLISENLENLSDAVDISKRVMGIIKFNVILAIVVKVLVLTLGLFGFAQTWMAVFADVGITVLSVLNTGRLLIEKK